MALMAILSGCEKSISFGSDNPFVLSSNISDGNLVVWGIDSCKAMITSGDQYLRITGIYYNVDNVFHAGGVETRIQMQALADGVAKCRIYNEKYDFDTIVSVKVGNGTPELPVADGYRILPANRQFPITQHSAVISVVGPKIVGGRVIDEFILRAISPSGNNSVDSSWMTLQLNKVGVANVKFFNEEWDTIIQVEVLPTYRTYDEPSLDFDDTRDSVIAKLGAPTSENTAEKTIVYVLQGDTYYYTVTVTMNSGGTINDYEVQVSDEAAKAELKSFIEERYLKYASTFNGYNIYVKAKQSTYPSMYDSETTVVVENFLHGIVQYKNPTNHSSW